MLISINKHYAITIFIIFLYFSIPVFAEGNYITVTGGGKIYYEERGKGEPLIFLHGHSLDCTMWDKQFKYFSNHYHAIRLDFRGYGQSSKQIEGFQFCHADDVITLMDSLGIHRAHIVGLSMGGFVAGDLLAMYPSRLLSCTHASGSIRSTPGPSTPIDEKEYSKRLQDITALKTSGIEEMKSKWINTLVSNHPHTRKPLTRMVNKWDAWQSLHCEQRLYYATDAWEMLKIRKPTIPVLILRGEEENKGTKIKESQWLSDVTLITLPSCGHMMNLQNPKLFNKTLNEWLLRVKDILD